MRNIAVPIFAAALTGAFHARCHAQGACGDPAGRDCFAIGVAPGCSDERCCTDVCAIDAFCCTVEWDSICRQHAVEVCAPSAPANDEPAGAITVLAGAFTISTIGSTAGLHAELPAGCEGIFGNQLQHDVWFRVVATRNGTARVSSCPATHPQNFCEFDPAVVVRLADGTPVGCNDENAACGGYAIVEWPIAVGRSYLVQVGAHDQFVGFGCFTLEEEGDAPPACSGDLTGDRQVNALDIATLLSGWGTPHGDATGDGLTNAQDIAAVLSAWGPCP